MVNNTLLGKARSLIKHSGLRSQYWGEATQHAPYLYNVSATAVLSMTKPHEKLFGTASFINSLRFFGCAAYAPKHVSLRSN